MGACPRCQESLPEKARFCIRCGELVETKTPLQANTVALRRPHEAVQMAPTEAAPAPTRSWSWLAYAGLAAAAGVCTFLMMRPAPIAPARTVTAISTTSAPPAAPMLPTARATALQEATVVAAIEPPTPFAKRPRHSAPRQKNRSTKSTANTATAAVESKQGVPSAATGSAADPTTVDFPAGHEAVSLESAKQTAEVEPVALLNSDNVRFVVRAHLPQVRACYESAFKDNSPPGRVEVGFAIDRGGRAIRIHTVEDSLHSEALSSCIENHIAEWEFPRPAGGKFELIYPFVFSGG